MRDIEDDVLLEAAMEGQITCPVCGNIIEPDCDACCCGWENPLIKLGMI